MKRIRVGLLIAFVATWLRAFSVEVRVVFFFGWGPLGAQRQWYSDLISPFLWVSHFPLGVLPEKWINSFEYLFLLQAYTAGFLIGYLWPPIPWQRLRSAVWLVIAGALFFEQLATLVLISANPGIVSPDGFNVWSSDLLVVYPLPFFALSVLGMTICQAVIELRRQAQERGNVLVKPKNEDRKG